MTRVKGEELGKKRKKVENKREEKDEGGWIGMKAMKGKRKRPASKEKSEKV